MKKLRITACAATICGLFCALLAFGPNISALAQVIYVPSAPIIYTNDGIADVPHSVPSASTQYATPAQIAGVPGYQYYVALTGFSYTFNNSTTNITLNPAGTLATGTITTAANPSDGQLECLFSSQTQTALTLTANTGQTVANAITAMTANTRYCYQYDLALATWERIQ